MLDPYKIREDFPIYQYNPHLCYLDNAATTQIPNSVLKSMNDYYTKHKSNAHRGMYNMSIKTDELYESSREIIASFIRCNHDEIIFTKNATESINLVAYSLMHSSLFNSDKNIILSDIEHHSNLVIWQLISKYTGVQLRFAKIDDTYSITQESINKLIDNNTVLISLVHVSNVLGNILDTEILSNLYRRDKILIMLDISQSITHISIDLKKIDVDFCVFSGHKICGPTGIGVLYGKKEVLNGLPVFLCGGDMVDDVSYDSFTPSQVPYKYEAGSMPIAEVIGLGSAIKYITNIGLSNIHKHILSLQERTLSILKNIDDINIISLTGKNSCGHITFIHKYIHPHDLFQIISDYNKNICIRVGHHCARLIGIRFKYVSSLRITFYIYNTVEDVDRFTDALLHSLNFFSKVKR